MSVYVICEDGKRRHTEPFATPQAAREWAEWGHACTRSHEFSFDLPRLPDPDTEGDPA